ncbi:hypothetical protein BDR04DRAFT_1149501 [Suillus decipiens]|nr:hypothetical protein BDR04DRAFT_1149501 [Suillus decipiens]
MSKHVASNDDAPTVKRLRIDEGSRTALLADEGAWRILEDYLTTSMMYPQMEEAFRSYLGVQYSEDEWKEAQHALFSGDSDDDVALENLHVVKAKHMPQTPCVHKVCSTTDRRLSRACIRPLCKPTKLKNPYLDLYAREDDDEEEVEEGFNNEGKEDAGEDNDEEEVEEDFNDEGKEDDDHTQKVTRLPGSSSATRFTTIINHLTSRFEDTPRKLSLGCQVSPSSIPGLVASASSQSQDGRMYLLHVHHKPSH